MTGQQTNRPRVVITTDMGEMELELYRDIAPATVDNFLKYARDGFYDGLIFHRVIRNFMVQGGGFYPGMKQKNATYPPVKNEAKAAKLRNARGTVAMARTSDPHSASAQFFINHTDNPALDWDKCQDGWGYCVFGKLIRGDDVVEKIANVPTGRKRGHGDVPKSPVVIRGVREG